MRLPKHLLVGGAVVIAMVATTAAALGATKTTTGPVVRVNHPAGAVKVAVANSGLGQILVDGRGRTLYLFGKDKGGKSACTGNCASFWPPLITSGKPLATAGANASLLGTIKRADGRLQGTYNHHPLYTFVKDTSKGQTNGEEIDAFGAEWYAVSAAGAKVEKNDATASGGGDPAPGGYGY